MVEQQDVPDEVTVMGTCGEWCWEVCSEDGWLLVYWGKGSADRNDDEGGEWFPMTPDYPPSNMINNPGDDCPEEIQDAVWAELDRQWSQWMAEREQTREEVSIHAREMREEQADEGQ